MKSIFNLFNIKYQDNLGLSGFTDESFCLYIYELFIKENRSILITTPNLTDANNLLNIFSSFTLDVLFFPMDDFLTSEAISISPDLMTTRLETLNELMHGLKESQKDRENIHRILERHDTRIDNNREAIIRHEERLNKHIN